MPVFKSVINKCDRAGLSINSVVSTIRTGQETSIGGDLEDWVSGQGIDWDWTAKNTPEQNGISERYGGLLTEKARCIRLHAKLPEDLYPECYLAAAYLMNRTPNKSLKWASPLVALQNHFGQTVRHEIAHLKVYGCKAYPLLKGKDKPPKSHKMKPRAFIGYLVGYDSSNIFRVWDPEKGTVSGYRDVIFNENELFNSYEEKDLIKKAQRSEFVEFEVFNPRPTVDLDEGDEDWMDLPIRRRIEELPQSQPEGVGVESPSDDEDDQPMTPKQPTTPSQLKTPDDTPFMTPNQDDIPYTSHLTGNGRTSRFAPGPSENSDAFNNQNVAQRKKRAKPKTAPKTVAFEELSETDQTPLEVTGFGPRRTGPSAEVEESNIIEEKRTRIPNKKYAAMALTPDEEQKFPAFHMAFMAGTRITNQPMHSNDLPDPPSNWRNMLTHTHADEFKKAAEVEFRALEGMKTWEIVDKAPNQHAIPLKWVFTYKFDADGYLIKHKTRLVVRGDLQKMDNQDVYAATLAFKVFRTLVA